MGWTKGKTRTLAQRAAISEGKQRQFASVLADCGSRAEQRDLTMAVPQIKIDRGTREFIRKRLVYFIMLLAKETDDGWAQACAHLRDAIAGAGDVPRVYRAASETVLLGLSREVRLEPSLIRDIAAELSRGGFHADALFRINFDPDDAYGHSVETRVSAVAWPTPIYH